VKTNGIKYPHIASSPRILDRVPVIKDTRIAVRTIAGYYQLGMTPDEILQSLPHLTLAQLHSALACYFEHQKEIDRDLKRKADVEHWRGQVRELAAA
jgi:uncharacterized protein (DUF433 family)